MDSLKVLEEKLSSLVELAKNLKSENAKLAEENAQLVSKVAMLEKTLQGDAKSIQDLKQEKELAKVSMNELIKHIDMLVENQS